MQLRGALQPVESEPSFLIPVFSDGDRLFLQMIDSDNRIAGWQPVDDPAAEQAVMPVSTEEKKNAGDDAYFIFQLPNGHLVHGSRNSIVEKLHRAMWHLRDYPYSRLEVAAFIGNENSLENAATYITRELSEANIEAAVNFRDYINKRVLSEYDDLRDERAWNMINDFGRALIKFYKIYVKLIHNSTEVKGRLAIKQYEMSVQMIMRYIFDPSFVSVLAAQLEKMDNEPSQFELNFDDEYYRCRSMVFREFSVSKKSLRLFEDRARHALFEERHGTDYRWFLRAMLDADRKVIEKVELTRLLNKADKKLQKRNLRVGALSVTYGLILLIASGENKDKVRKQAVTAIAAGLKDLTPPQEMRKAA